MIKAQCHCGAVTIQVSRPPAELTECHCSVCSKLGMIWTYYPDADVEVAGATDTYVCNKRVIAFHRCRVCGCTAYWQTLGQDFGRMGLNARLFASVNLAELPRMVTKGPE